MCMTREPGKVLVNHEDGMVRHRSIKLDYVNPDEGIAPRTTT